MIKVNLKVDYPEIWKVVRNDLVHRIGILDMSSKKAESLFKEIYDLDVEIAPHTLVGTFHVDEKDWTLFLLKWQHQ